MLNLVKIAVAASDTPERERIVGAIKSIDDVVVSTFDLGKTDWSDLLAFNPDVVVCRHDNSMRNCELLIKWLDEQLTYRKVMTMAFVDQSIVHSLETDILSRLDQLLYGVPSNDDIRRNVSLLVRLVRSENEVLQSNMLNMALKVSEDKYRSIVNSLEDGYFEIDLGGRILFLNASMERILGIPVSEVMGQTFGGLLVEESAARFSKLVDRVQQHRLHAKGERWEVKTSTGHFRVVELSLVPMEQPADNAIRCLARDITSINEIELEIARKDEQFRAAINSTKEALYILTSLRDDSNHIIDFIFSDVNKAGFELLKFPAEKVIGARLCELLPVNREPRFFDRYVRVVETHEIIDEEYQIDVDHFKPKWAHHTVVPMGDGVAITVRDVTETKNTAHRIEADRNLLHTIINAIPDEIYLKDVDRRFVMVNRGVLNMLGKKSFDEVIGKRDEDLISQKYHDMAISQDQQVLESGIPVIDYEGYAYADETQTEIKRSTLVSKFPYFDKDGNIVGLIGINKDITDRKRAELRIKRSLREKEVLLKEIHHRVKNNLAVISGLLFMQAENLENEDMKQVLYDSEIRIRSMAMIHEKLYHHDMYSGIEFGSYVKDLVATIENTYKNNGCEIKVNLNTPPTYIDLNRAMPCALIVNEALSNAYKHAFKGSNNGEIWIDFSQTEGTYRLSISDNGIGLPEDFNPDNASSLGMVLIHGLVRQLGSTLYIGRSNGTRLSFEFGGEEKAPW